MRKKKFFFYSTGEPGKRHGIYCECAGEDSQCVFILYIHQMFLHRVRCS